MPFNLLLNDLPNDITHCLFDMLDGLDMIMMSDTNKKFKQIAMKKKYKKVKFQINKCYYLNFYLPMINAAFNGYLDVIIYLRSLHYHWNEDALMSAAENGKLEIVQWLKNNGCPLNKINQMRRKEINRWIQLQQQLWPR